MQWSEQSGQPVTPVKEQMTARKAWWKTGKDYMTVEKTAPGVGG